MNKLDLDYQNLLKEILETGTVKKTRSGGTISVFGRQIRHKMSDGFPLLTTKRVAFSQVKSELAWFLAGSSDIRVLWKSNNHIWDGDWYKNHLKTTNHPLTLERMIELGLDEVPSFDDAVFDLGPIYGKQWRKWTKYEFDGGSRFEPSHIDQIQNILDDLVNNPDSRRMVVNAWNVGEIDQMTLPPCHYGFQVYTRELSLEERQILCPVWTEDSYYNGKLTSPLTIDWEKTPKRAISLMWNQRSVDTPLGLPFNIASYGLLLEMLAQEVNMVPDELIGTLGDVHIYLNQIDGVKEQLTRESRPLPKIQLQDGMYCHLTGGSEDVIINDYNPHPAIKFPLSN